jgi:hypothetical protein
VSGKDFDENESLRRVQYLGASGYTDQCLVAIDAILNSGCLPKKAIIVSTRPYGNNRRQDHLFVFVDWDYFPITVVPSGFASGYSGGGPRGFSLAICLIREKGIPIWGIDLDDVNFRRIDRGDVKYSDDPPFKDILLRSEKYPWPWPGWTNEAHEQMLERGLLWQECYWRQPQTDQITRAISEIDIKFPTVGKKLRLARRKVDESQNSEELQQVGILIRDAWIEFSKRLCSSLHVDTTGVENDKVVDRLRKLKLEDKLFDSCRASFNLSLKVQHDRRVRRDEAELCLLQSLFSIHTLIHELANSRIGDL